MKAIHGWDKVQATADGFQTVPAGGYTCMIMKAEEKPNRNGGGSHLEIWFDIMLGEYKGFYAEDYARQTGENKFWRGIVYQNIPDENSPKYDQQCGFFKRFTNAVEASNEGYHWDWNEALLKGKRIGVIFGEVERVSRAGTRYMTTRPDSITDTQSIDDAKYRIPKPRYLAPETNIAPTTTFTEVEDDGDLPF